MHSIEGTVTVQDFWNGDPIAGARVDCEINGVTYAYDANNQGIATIIYPIISQPESFSKFPKFVDLTIKHSNYQTEYYNHPINYNKFDTDVNGNITTYYYKGYFQQTIWMKPN